MCAEGEALAGNPVCLVHLLDLGVGRPLDGDGVVREELREESIEVLGAGADDDLRWPHTQIAGAGEIAGDCLAQLGGSVVGGIVMNFWGAETL